MQFVPFVVRVNLISQRLRHDKVEGRGYLDVFPIAADKGNRMSKALHNRGIVGKEISIRLCIRLAKEGCAEHLRGLNQAVFAARHGF